MRLERDKKRWFLSSCVGFDTCHPSQNVSSFRPRSRQISTWSIITPSHPPTFKNNRWWLAGHLSRKAGYGLFMSFYTGTPPIIESCCSGSAARIATREQAPYLRSRISDVGATRGRCVACGHVPTAFENLEERYEPWAVAITNHIQLISIYISQNSSVANQRGWKTRRKPSASKAKNSCEPFVVVCAYDLEPSHLRSAFQGTPGSLSRCRCLQRLKTFLDTIWLYMIDWKTSTTGQLIKNRKTKRNQGCHNFITNCLSVVMTKSGLSFRTDESKLEINYSVAGSRCMKLSLPWAWLVTAWRRGETSLSKTSDEHFQHQFPLSVLVSLRY